MTKFKNEVIFVQLSGKRIIVDEIKTPASYNSPEWKFAEGESHKSAKILDESDIQFALSSVDGKFSVIVGENDSEKAIKLLKEAYIKNL